MHTSSTSRRRRRAMRHLGEVVLRNDVIPIEVNDTGGMFYAKFTPGSDTLRVIASHGDGWDHVSVSCHHRCPTWNEMSFIKSVFFFDAETVMQLHVPSSDHVNYHPFCLHL